MSADGIVTDVVEPDDLARLVSKTTARFGRIDILVNNAGRPAHRPFVDNDDAEWRYDIDLKLMAAVRLSRLVPPNHS